MPTLSAPLRQKPLHPASAVLRGLPAEDACCGGHGAAPVAVPTAERPKRHTLADLDMHLHCSVIGTCLSTGELRKLVPRYHPHVDRTDSSDLEIHHAAVEMCCEEMKGWKEINKALDARHVLAIKRFKPASDTAALQALWRQAMASGDIPGAYWALMTHPLTTPEVRAQAFGDVHMLSHLVGAANRADIRRLVALEEESQQLKLQNERQQERLREQALRHAAELQALKEERRQPAVPDTPAEPEAKMAQARRELAERDSRLALHIARSAVAEKKLQESEARAEELQAQLTRSEQACGAAQAETLALEWALAAVLAEDGSGTTLPPLHGKCIAYVGGRPGTVAMLARLVAAAGGQLLAHDGGIEERRGALPATLARAHTVLFPVDCISHPAMHVIKRSCEQSGASWHPLRSSGVAGAILLLQRLFPPTEEPASTTRICIRHG